MGGVDWDKMIDYIHENPDQILYSGPDEGQCGDYPKRSLEEHYEIMRNITNIMDYGDLRGFYKIMDEALKNGDWHEYSGVGFFVKAERSRLICSTAARFRTAGAVTHGI